MILPPLVFPACSNLVCFKGPANMEKFTQLFLLHLIFDSYCSSACQCKDLKNQILYDLYEYYILKNFLRGPSGLIARAHCMRFVSFVHYKYTSSLRHFEYFVKITNTIENSKKMTITNMIPLPFFSKVT